MKNTIPFRLLALFYCAIFFSQPLFSQQFESTFGSLANHEDAQDGKPIPNGRYIVLSNTLSYGPASRILLTRLSPLGAVEMHATLHDPANPTVRYFGTSIALDLSAAGVHTGYFITGCRTAPNGRQIILLRTNLTGTVSWAKVLPASDNTGNLDERGVSVERQSNGDVTVAGTSFSAAINTHQFILSRFSSAGVQLWSHRYRSTTGQGFEATEACNGFSSGVAVVAVTGRFRLNGGANHHTFLSCINAASGVELWRRSYNSTQARDEGLDVVYKPLTTSSNGVVDPAAFLVVGSATQIHPTMWVVRADPANGVASSKIYVPGGFTSGFLAEAVSLDVTGTKAAITGRVITQFPPTLLSGTFAMVLPFFGTELPDWTFYYASSNPANPNLNTRAIAPITGLSSGYFIVCGTPLTGSAFNDVHGIRINSVGSNGDGCSTTALSPTRTPMGTSQGRSFLKAAYTWTNFSLTRTAQPFTQEFCKEPSLNGNAGDRTDDLTTGVPAPRLFPNPVAGGQNAVLALDLPEAGPVQLRVFDSVGREVWSFCETLGEGQQQLELPASGWANGAYFVQVQLPTGSKTMKLMVSNH